MTLPSEPYEVPERDRTGRRPGRGWPRRVATLLFPLLLTPACAGGAHLRARWVPAADVQALVQGHAGDPVPAAPAGSPEASALASAALASWMDGPVSLIATDGERQRFRALVDDAARAAFIEAFWRRRDPGPHDGVNEARQEFARRVAVAEALFGDGDTPGYETVFGIALIAFGFPHSVETHAYGAATTEARTGAFAVPATARSRDEILWRYVVDEAGGQARPGRAAPKRFPSSMVVAAAETDPPLVAAASGLPLRIVRFTYYAGAWRMGCGSQLWFDSWYSSGVGVWTPYGGCRGGCGREVALSAPEVPGSGVSTWGPLLTHGDASPVYLPPLLDPICRQFIDQAILRALRAVR